jgi:hypothetical protein
VSASRGWAVRVAAVWGDDVTERYAELAPQLLPFPGEQPAHGDDDKPASANVYFGARGIAAALAAGAQVRE